MKPNMHMIRIFGSAHRYYQGPGALGLVGDIVQSLGQNPVLVADEIVYGLIASEVSTACAAHGLALIWVKVEGDVTRTAVQSLVRKACEGGSRPDVVIAAGGGKGVDTGKAVALELGAHLVVVPTSASNDGPCSRLFVYYDEHHHMVSVERLARNPDAVVVDTRQLVKAPRQLLVSGIGDALCKLYEGDQTRRVDGINSYGGRNTLAAEQLSAACNLTIREYAVTGLAALATGVPDEAFERLTEALVLLSGLAFENSGLSIAHSFTRGLPLAQGTLSTLHGYHVGYGLLVQFILEQRSDDFIKTQLDFYRSVGLAVSLRELGASDWGLQTMQLIAQGTLTSPHITNFQRPLTTDDLVQAMKKLAVLGAATLS